MQQQNNKTCYFKYYNTKKFNNKENSRFSNHKQLPHITEEYNFRITNHLLIKKILSPKRDKIIMNSLENVRQFMKSSSQQKRLALNSQSKERFSHKIVQKKALIRKNLIRNQIMKDENYQQIWPSQNYTNSVMIKSVEQKIESKSKQNNHQKNDSQSGQTVIERFTENDANLFTNSFYSHSLHRNTFSNTVGSLKCRNYNIDTSFKSNNLKLFGRGPTILLITHIKITSNPTLKDETLVQIQINQKRPSTTNFHNLHNIQQRAICSDPVQYRYLPNEQYPKSAIKFVLRLSKKGNFLPIKVWKYVGVQSVQLGSLDLPLNLYRSEKNAILIGKQQVKWQPKQQDSQIGRIIVTGQLDNRIPNDKSLKGQTNISIKYQLYSKKLTKCVNKYVQTREA